MKIDSLIGRFFRRLWWQLVLNRHLCRLYDVIRVPKSLGAFGELESERFLLRTGLIIVARGFSDSRGEIDIIAVDQQELVFLEVKTRSSDSAGSPEEAVDLNKQARIGRTAMSFMKMHELLENPCRFDVLAVRRENRITKIEHFKNAFELAPDVSPQS